MRIPSGRPYAQLVCRKCGDSTRVKDSRGSRGCVRRRRYCVSCGHRFTTWEQEGQPVLPAFDARLISRHIMERLGPIVSAAVLEAFMNLPSSALEIDDHNT